MSVSVMFVGAQQIERSQRHAQPLEQVGHQAGTAAVHAQKHHQCASGIREIGLLGHFVRLATVGKKTTGRANIRVCSGS